MALSFNDIYDRVKPYSGFQPAIKVNPKFYAEDLLILIALAKAQGIDSDTLLDMVTDLLEEGE